MRIRSLDILGFKSFVDRTVLAFDEGISAIVGPNGCGKSNVVDAVRWVMGEQNPRHLRGRMMEDVIFAGTASRPAVGMAEVVLTLDNSNGRAPAEYSAFSEIQIARRLYRSGESEYLINKVPCRLRDILDFFTDTGIGIRGYTIVEQGQIAAILSTRPEERRIIFEEAAGIGKYRERRRETERKLAATEQNLVRMTDILGELRRQISSLERQSRKAKRYKELAARVRDLELAVTWEAFRSDAARLAGAEGEHEDLRASTAALDAKVARAEANLEAERSRHLNREQELQRASEQLYTLRTEIQSLESRVEYERREREGLLRLAGEREVEGEELEALLSANEAALGETLEESSCLDERIQTERAQLAEREGVLREQTESMAALQGRREALQSRLVDLSAESATLESRSEALEDRRGEVELRLRQNEEPLEARALEIEGFRREELALEARVREALAEKDDLGRHLADVLRAHAQGSAELEQLRGEVSSARERLQQASARLEALREAAKLESTRVDEVLERLPAERRRYVHGILSDVLCAEAGLEPALEAVLAGRLDGVLVEDSKSALALLDWFRKEDAGRATLLSMSPPDATEHGFVPLGRPLLDFVSPSPPFRPLVQRLLRDVYLVEDLTVAVERFGVQDPPAVFVTREGELLDRSGALTGGTRVPPGALSRPDEIRRLEEEFQTLETSNVEMERAMAVEVGRLGELAAEIEITRNRYHTAELAVVNLERDLERLRERAKEAIEFVYEHRELKQQLDSQIVRMVRERGQVEERAAVIASGRADAERLRGELSQEIAALGRELERGERRLVQYRVELAELTTRREQLRETEARLQNAVGEGRDWLTRRREDVRSARERAEQLARSAAEASRLLAQRIREEENVRAGQESLRQTYEASRCELEAAEAGVRAVARERDAAREKLSSSELVVQEARLRRDQLIERILERYGIDLATYEPPAEHLAGEPAARQAELAQLRESLQSLGDVHLGAIEEYEEVSERCRYLGEQKADLELSIERLRNAIARINRTSRARFRETFEAVNAEFQRMFPRLFSGGRAHLALTEVDDVLEAGIEISAQPPGKRLQNVNLLSGGEKTLTAIALLMAVFVVKPSPFFLLDEVDAALDDANVTRFNQLLKEMSKISQFLLITHNKGTIEIADTLFGVTMQAPGLSNLVTVDLVS